MFHLGVMQRVRIPMRLGGGNGGSRIRIPLMLDKQRVRPILLAGAIAGFGGLALIGGARPAAAQYNPYCSYPNYDPYYCQVYGAYAYDYPSYDYGYDYPYGGGLAFGFGGGDRFHGGFRGGGFHGGGFHGGDFRGGDFHTGGGGGMHAGFGAGGMGGGHGGGGGDGGGGGGH